MESPPSPRKTKEVGGVVIELLLALLLRIQTDEHADTDWAGDIYCAKLLEKTDD
jgi:hypothetical protein